VTLPRRAFEAKKICLYPVPWLLSGKPDGCVFTVMVMDQTSLDMLKKNKRNRKKFFLIQIPSINHFFKWITRKNAVVLGPGRQNIPCCDNHLVLINKSIKFTFRA
jgi:hypothetical protein